MSFNIAGFIKKLLPSMDKSDIEDDMQISMESIPTVMEVYADLEQVLKASSFNSKENKAILKEFYKELKLSKVRLLPRENIASDTLTIFKNIKANGEFISKEVSDALNDVIVSQALTAVKTNLIRAVAHYYFITKFALDLSNLFYVNEAENGKIELTNDFKLNKKEKELIVSNVWIYARLLSVYGSDPSVFMDKLKSISEITLPKDRVDEAVDTYSSDNVDLFNNLPEGFIGSPIYSIRLMFATWEADRYKNLRDKKRLLELRYLHLKMLQESGNSDANMEKDIMYLQKRCTDIQYKLTKIEESVE